MNIDINTIFKTDDIGIASFFLSRGQQIIDITSDRPGHFFFIFSNPKGCDKLKTEFLNNGLIPARELLARREELINEIKNKR